MINYQELLVLLLRIVYSGELLLLGIVLLQILVYLNATSVYKTVRNIAWSLTILGVIRLITSFLDFYFQHNTGFYSLIFNDIIYAYLAYVFIKLTKILRKTDFTAIKVNRILDEMILKINNTINKNE